MQKSSLIIKTFLFVMCLFSFGSVVFAQSKEHTPAIDMERMKAIIESRDKEFSKHLFDGDSMALANMYTKDAQLGTSKGPEILSSLGKWVRSAIKNDARLVDFITTILTSDGEFLIEVGIAETRDSQHNLKSKGKYLVVWKQEDGLWKLYRDIGL